MTPPTQGLRERKKQERRQEILLNSRHLFDQNGFEATSIEGVAAAVDVSAGTIYKFFPTKIDILSGLLRDDLESHMADTPQVTAVNTPNPQEGIYSLIKQMLIALEKLPKNDLSLITAHAIATGQSTETGRTYVATDRDLRDQIYSLLLAYRKNGAIPSSADIDMICGLVFSTAHGEYISWLAGEYTGIDNILARLQRFFSLIFAGVVASGVASSSKA